MKKTLSFVFAAFFALCIFTGCGAEGSGEKSTGTSVEFTGTEAKINGGGCSFKDGVFAVEKSGTFTLTGHLSGSIKVDVGAAQEDVRLIFDGLSVENPQGPALLIQQAKNTRIELKEGSENLLVSGVEGSPFDEANASGAAIYAEDDLDIEGSGKLLIKGYINNGIGCKDDLDINGGEITVSAVNNGIRASESFELKGGKLDITAGNDGIKTSSAKKEGKGFITISDGEAVIQAAGDGLSSAAELNVQGGILTVKAQNGDGIKAGRMVNISGGSISAEAADNGIKALTGVKLSGGTVNIVSAGDGLQAGDKSMDSAKNIEQTGGELYVSCGKQALKADEVKLGGGTALLLQNEELSGAGISCTRPLLSGQIKGAKGSTVQVENLGEILSGSPYNTIVFSHGQLESGKEYKVSNGLAEVVLTAG